MGFAFQVVFGQSSCLLPILGLNQGLSWWCADLSGKMDSSVKVSRRLTGCLGWHVLPPPFVPPEFSWLVFSGSTEFFIGTSCYETVQASYSFRCFDAAFFTVCTI